MTRQGLFREEFLERLQSRPTGSVVLPPQRAIALAVCVSAICMCALVLVLAIVKYTRYEHARGTVVAQDRATVVLSPFENEVVVSSILVEPGDEVLVGMPTVYVTGPNMGIDERFLGKANSFPKVVSDNKESLQAALITTTHEGRVEKVFVKKGSQISVGDPLLTTRQNGRGFRFEVLANDVVLGRIRTGDEAMVKVDAYPVQRTNPIPGHIVSISENALSFVELSRIYGIPPSQESFFVVTIEADEQANLTGYENLRPGMSIEVAFPIETMSMLRWISHTILRRGRTEATR